ncbi:terminase TerL endonuclease subunit [Macrococcus bovicus]|uniref:Terminase large subunit n=1 Tax=Macrococcus bovicus TaxID=69968 RepID=A0A4R6C2W0_9STAP|nr:terminase TerL endonuclease subunit [Macrococcus bovicus]TDM15707.1 terminase large subunit [Macrococcus bovicus]
MKIPAYVTDYIQAYRDGKIKFNKERVWLVEYLEQHILNREDLYFDEDKIEKCIKFIEKWHFKLELFQKFFICFIFLYKSNGNVFYRRFLFLVGRGGGKNGLLSGIAHFLMTEFHGVPKYNVSIVANSEDQAKTSFEEIYDAIDLSKKQNTTLHKAFATNLQKIQSRATKSILRYRTSNASTKDGLRDGCVIYDEIHQYTDNATVRVFSSGLGKKKDPREFFLGSNGYVRGGYLDSMLEKALGVLKGMFPDSNLFPFICKLDEADEVDDTDNWQKANPMFELPLSPYAETLYETMLDEYADFDDASVREEFMTKRMNIPEVDESKIIAPWEDILATNRLMPDLSQRMCIGGLDYASVKDFAAVGLLFRKGDEYFWKTHSFVLRNFLKKVKIDAPIEKWEKDGLLTILDDPTIHPTVVVNWFTEMSKEYGLEKVIMDNYRSELLRTYFEEANIDYEVIKNPKAIHDLLHPRIETIFSNHLLVLEDNPLMRWYINNVAVKVNHSTGKREYIKKDEFKRKTDGFHAFLHALYRADEIIDFDVNEAFDMLDALDF